MTEPLRVIFMGTPDFAVPCLDRLIEDGHQVLTVVTQPDRPKGRGQKLAFSAVKVRALEYQVPVFQPERIREPEVIEQIVQYKPDLIIVVAFGQLLPQNILDLPPLGCINVHASLLPHYRGAAPIHWAVVNGETRTGVTTMRMDTGMDTGDMLLTAETAIGPDETTGELYQRLQELGASLLSDTVRQLIHGAVVRRPQDHAAATYAPLLTRETERIDWNNPATAIHNQIRGLNPWPGSFSHYRDSGLKLWQTRILPESSDASPGQIVRMTGEGCAVATGKGLLEILEVQPESKRHMKAHNWVCGYGIQTGDKLG
ncbi:MAG TPA: methionyl-tRNA formyltransferase [Patescibacteria group bacterium]|nr:methionyl-tRNA formyltransferase [Patescibacteria group bacterium]